MDSHYLVNQIQTGKSGRSPIISEINKIKKRYNNIIICYSNPDPENIKPMMALANTACNLIFNAPIYKSTKNDFRILINHKITKEWNNLWTTKRRITLMNRIQL